MCLEKGRYKNSRNKKYGLALLILYFTVRFSLTKVHVSREDFLLFKRNFKKLNLKETNMRSVLLCESMILY